MIRFILLAFSCFLSVIAVTAQQQIHVHNSGNVMYQTTTGDVGSIKFQNNNLFFNYPASTVNFPVASIDSITFTASSSGPDAIYIIYNNDDVTIINPYASQGITITATAGHVISTSTIATPGIVYNILGNSGNGSLMLSSEQAVQLVLSNLTLTNPAGAAFSISGAMTTTVFLSAGTVNTLSDGAASTANATLLAAEELVIDGGGTLSVTGLKKHAVASGTIIRVENGTITIPSAVSDGFNSTEFIQQSGSISIQSGSDGIDASETATINGGSLTIVSTTNDVKAIKGKTGGIVINDGTIDLTVSGAQSKGLSTDADVVINGGNLTITASGDLVLETSGSGFDPSYCTGIKTKGKIIINDGTIDIICTATNKGGKGLSADGNIVINGGDLQVTTAGNGATYTDETGVLDAYTACAIKSDAHISLLGGNINCSSSGTGGKGISADSTLTIGILNAADNNLVIHVATSGNRIYVSGTGENADYANPKAIKSEGNLTVNSGIITVNCTQTQEGSEGMESKATLTINGGDISITTYDDCINAANHIQINGGKTFCKSNGNDGIDSNGTITITGGLTIAQGIGNPECGFDCDNNTFRLDGGVVVGTGGSTSTPSTASTDYSLKYTGATSGAAICIKKSSGDVVLMYQLPTLTTNGGGGGPGGPGGGGNGMTLLFSDPNLAPGTYTLQSGGTITGGTNFNGYTTGGTYTGGTTTSFTISSKVTTIN